MRFSPVGIRFLFILFCLLATAGLATTACQGEKRTETAPATPATAPAAPAVAPAAAPKTQLDEVLALMPGKSLGPISLGMEEQDLKTLGLEIRNPAPGFVEVGPYRVALTDGRVASVSVEFPKVAKVVAIGDKKIDQTMSLETAAAAIGDCGAPTHNDGASILECRGGTMSVTRGGRSEVITSVGIAKGK